MLDWLYELLGTMLFWFSKLFNGHYVFALLLYAVLFKLLFLPFAVKQQKNQIKMAQLAPKIELIKAKYRGRTDQVTMQKQQQEIMELQQKEGYNPMAGCLPLLIQFPIIIFLYGVIRNPLSHICRLTDETVLSIYNSLNNASLPMADFSKIDQIKLVGQIRTLGTDAFPGVDLSRLPDFTLFNTNLGLEPLGKPVSFANWSWLVIIPILAAALTWLSMVLSRRWNSNPTAQMQDQNANASMKMMDIMMPAMTLFMAFGFSSMMGIYWIYQSALGILQTFIISKVMPLPKFSEEDIKNFKKAQKEAEKEARNAAKTATKHRSLHYIDDDDYDSLPEVQGNDNNNNIPSGQMDLPEI